MANEKDQQVKENWTKWSQLVAQTWADEKLKQKLIGTPDLVLREHGIEVPAGVEVRVVENTDKVSYLTLPARPDVNELHVSQLTGVAGGVKAASDCVVIGPITVTPTFTGQSCVLCSLCGTTGCRLCIVG
jgi:hypothetical protein